MCACVRVHKTLLLQIRYKFFETFFDIIDTTILFWVVFSPLKLRGLGHFFFSFSGACNEGWQLYEGFCFFISTEKKTFKNAIAACSARGSHLLSLTEAKRDIFLRKFIDAGKKGLCPCLKLFIESLLYDRVWSDVYNSI